LKNEIIVKAIAMVDGERIQSWTLVAFCFLFLVVGRWSESGIFHALLPLD